MPPKAEYQGVFDCQDCVCSKELSPWCTDAQRQLMYSDLGLDDVCDICDGGEHATM